MKYIYFVTEGITDKIVIEGLIDCWLDGEDFISRSIQPPSSDYADGLSANLSEGWKGVCNWCAGERMVGPAGRDEAIKNADCLIVHIDADVVTDPEFKAPPLTDLAPQLEMHVTGYAITSPHCLVELCPKILFCVFPHKIWKRGSFALSILTWLMRTPPSNVGQNLGRCSFRGYHIALSDVRKVD
ncbi:MAG: hypothetical protein KKD63_02345 [Proteobacteria bacterium]|nr:hypothetical protein [Desulfobulbaceae bacterium]MBU4151701.1 hypothetical protein [Pseudomonadota bacterium]MDP2107366.1 hypothetical protein [Desulfobulbaceae bacterium]